MTFRLRNEKLKESLMVKARKVNSVHNMKDDMKKNKKGKKMTVGKVFARIGIAFGSTLLVIVLGLVGLLSIIHYGPSVAARDVLVLSAMESSAGHFLATWFLPDDLIDEIIKANSVVPTDDMTDTSLIKIPEKEDNGDDDPDPGEDKYDKSKIEIVDVSGKTYKGKMMIVYDPSRVYVGTPAAYGKDKEGVKVIDMAIRDNAIGAVNGGGFEDTTGKGNGGIPIGIVISKGKLMWGEKNENYEVIGFDNKGILIVGNMTAQKALDMGIRDAVSFGPILIVNGEPCEIQGTGGGLNPRTAIGQRADGAVLLLVVDGRQANSPGATYSDLVDIMLKFEAVNAANLDGGSSSYMVYNNEIITTRATLYQPRRMATAILVSRVDEQG